MTEKTERNSAFEVLRLVAMFMIVYLHGLSSTSLRTGETLGVLDNVSWFLYAFVICAVDLFYLLTGYFAQSRSYNIGGILRIWGKTIFYSFTIYIIAVISGGVKGFSLKTAVCYLFPVLTRQYWFIQVYVFLILLAPYIVAALETLSEKRHLTLIGIMLAFLSLHQTFIPVKLTVDFMQGYGITWAVVLLIVGSFIRRYGDRFIDRIPAGVFLVGYVFVAVCIFASNWLIVRFDIAQGVTSRENFYGYNSISVFAESVCLFCFFVKMSRKNWHNKYVNRVSASALSIYLISAHPCLISNTWTKILNMTQYLHSLPVYYTLLFVFSIIIMAFCLAVDMLLGTVGGGVKKWWNLRKYHETK